MNPGVEAKLPCLLFLTHTSTVSPSQIKIHLSPKGISQTLLGLPYLSSFGSIPLTIFVFFRLPVPLPLVTASHNKSYSKMILKQSSVLDYKCTVKCFVISINQLTKDLVKVQNTLYIIFSHTDGDVDLSYITSFSDWRNNHAMYSYKLNAISCPVKRNIFFLYCLCSKTRK